MTQTFQTSDGLTLAYDDQGAGHPLLCLAGLTRNMADFDVVVDGFAQRARIVRLDARGRGQSEAAPDWHSYTLVREAQDVLELLDHLGLDRVSILGTSRGGLLAMTLSVAHKHRLAGVIFVDIGPKLDGGGLDQIMGHLGRKPPFGSYDEAADALPEAMAPRFANVPRATWRAHAERIWRDTGEGLDLRYDPHLRDAVLEAASAGPMPDLWPVFDLFAGLPIGLIRGANSDLLTRETADEMRLRRPDMLFADVPDRGHVPFLDEPDATAVIAAYLDGIATAGGAT